MTYLGFDYGARYIGIAVGQSDTRLAHALDTVRVHRTEPDWHHVACLVGEWRPDAFVVGLPLNMDDSDNPMTVAARRFGNRLRGRYNLPVHMVDERLTSIAARHQLLDAGVRVQNLKAKLDKLAAQTILQAFLDAQPTRAP